MCARTSVCTCVTWLLNVPHKYSVVFFFALFQSSIERQVRKYFWLICFLFSKFACVCVCVYVFMCYCYRNGKKNMKDMHLITEAWPKSPDLDTNRECSHTTYKCSTSFSAFYFTKSISHKRGTYLHWHLVQIIVSEIHLKSKVLSKYIICVSFWMRDAQPA